MKLIEVLAVIALVAPLSAMAAGDMKAVGVVKKVDVQARSATIAHEAIKSLKWPAMTMTFQVKDKAALDKLSEGKTVEFEFEQKGKDYVITGVK